MITGFLGARCGGSGYRHRWSLATRRCCCGLHCVNPRNQSPALESGDSDVMCKAPPRASVLFDVELWAFSLVPAQMAPQEGQARRGRRAATKATGYSLGHSRVGQGCVV